MAAWQIEYFGDRLVTKEGEKSTADALAGKDLIGIYFSAHWVRQLQLFQRLPLADRFPH
jgi:hypothetical protein